MWATGSFRPEIVFYVCEEPRRSLVPSLPLLGVGEVELVVVGLMEEPEEGGWDWSSCQARCGAGGYTRKNMKHCTPPHTNRH